VQSQNCQEVLFFDPTKQNYHEVIRNKEVSGINKQTGGIVPMV
jgi:hypothetical protein